MDNVEIGDETADSVLDRCIADAGEVNEGYWSPYAVGAWIASNDDSFVAAVQKFEKLLCLDRGHCHAAGGWLTLGNAMGERFGKTLSDTMDELRVALQAGRLEGVAVDNETASPIPRHKWVMWNIEHHGRGTSLIGGDSLRQFQFPSEQVRDCFPAPIAMAGQDKMLRAPDKLRGVLPPNAKPNDRKHEELAHSVAQIMRAKLIPFQSAAKEKIGVDVVGRESVIRATRTSFDKMYDRSGRPIKN